MALSHNEGILVGDVVGDVVGVLFQCGVGGKGGGEPDAPVTALLLLQVFVILGQVVEWS